MGTGSVVAVAVAACLTAGGASADVEVEVSAARCDPHAVIESEKTYSFPIWVRVGQAPAADVVLEPESDARTAMQQLLEVGCDVDH